MVGLPLIVQVLKPVRDLGVATKVCVPLLSPDAMLVIDVLHGCPKWVEL